MTITVPFIPPSVNHYAKHTRTGKHYVSSAAYAFKSAVAVCLRGQFVTGKSFYVKVGVTMGAKDKGDIDNFPKLVLDGLADAGAFRDKKGERMSDAHVDQLLVTRDRDSRPKRGFTVITVEAIR